MFQSPGSRSFRRRAANLIAGQQLQARQTVYAAPLDTLAALDLTINGSMRISQQNGTNAVTLTATGSTVQTYALDQWVCFVRGTYVGAAAQVTDAPFGYDNSLKITVSTLQSSLGTSDQLTIAQPIEGLRTSRLSMGTASAKTTTLGFWVKSFQTGPFSGSIQNYAQNRSWPFSFIVAA